jgi:hypothetical protein
MRDAARILKGKNACRLTSKSLDGALLIESWLPVAALSLKKVTSTS